MTGVACAVYVRRPTGPAPGRWRYERLWVHGWAGDGCLRLPEAPAVGDRVAVNDTAGLVEVVVVERSWQPAGYGSMTWPHGQPAQVEPVAVTLICELPVSALFEGEEEPEAQP